MKKKLLIYLVSMAMSVAIPAIICATVFTDTKAKFTDNSHFVDNADTKKIYNEVYNKLSDYMKLKVSMYDVYFVKDDIKKVEGFEDKLGAGVTRFQDSVVLVDYSQDGSKTPEFVLSHEIGHVLDSKSELEGYVAARGRFLYSTSPEFLKIVVKDVGYTNPETYKPYTDEELANLSSTELVRIVENHHLNIYSDEQIKAMSSEEIFNIVNKFNNEYTIEKIDSLTPKQRQQVVNTVSYRARKLYSISDINNMTSEDILRLLKQYQYTLDTINTLSDEQRIALVNKETAKGNDIFSNEYAGSYLKDGISDSKPYCLYYLGSPQEYFAETFAYFLNNPKTLKQYSPEMYRYMQSLFHIQYEVPTDTGAEVASYLEDFFSAIKKPELIQQLVDKNHDYYEKNNLLEEVNKKIEDAKTPKDKQQTKDPNESNVINNPINNDVTNTNKNNAIYDKEFENYFGWVKKDGKWYYVDQFGRKAIGWFEEDGKQYYFNDDGSMKTGLVTTPEGKKVYYDEYGETKRKTGWIQDGKNWCYLNEDGSTKTGWVKDKGQWYYMDDNGVMKTGWVDDKGTWYYLGSEGSMKTGWIQDKGQWYYLSDNGSMKTGWIQDNGKWYYLNSNGSMATNTTVDGYTIGADGAWIK